MSRTTLVTSRAALAWVAAAVVLVAAAMIVPAVTGENVKVHFPPLHAWWRPEFVWFRSVPVVILGVVLVLVLPRLAQRASWGGVLALGFGSTWAWTMAVALTDGLRGISRVYSRRPEYLYDALSVDNVWKVSHEFISRIPYSASPDNWHTHVAGHPLGALLVHVGLARIGFDTPLTMGLVVIVIGSTSTVAALMTLRRLGSEEVARSALPWIVLAPWVIYLGVNGDAIFTAVAAWGLALLTYAATATKAVSMRSLIAGMVLGASVFLSYGLVLLGVLALTVLILARAWRPLPWAVIGALIVVAIFAAIGFAWWEAFPVLHQRYYDGIAADRSYAYWVWADVAAWTFSVGLATWAAFAGLKAALTRGDQGRRVVAGLAIAALLTIVIACLSGMSKAETERIFMPFTLWVLPAAVLLPERWRTPLLLSQVATTLLIEQLLLTRW